MGDSVIPELGQVKKGKVRDIYFSGENVVMVASDRVSAFDYVLPNLIPFKGEVLNRIAKFAFDNTKDIVPNALVGDDLIGMTPLRCKAAWLQIWLECQIGNRLNPYGEPLFPPQCGTFSIHPWNPPPLQAGELHNPPHLPPSVGELQRSDG